MMPQTYQIKPDGFAVNENVGVIYGNRNGIDFVILPFRKLSGNPRLFNCRDESAKRKRLKWFL